MYLIVTTIFLLTIVFLIDTVFGKRSISIKGKHVVVTGGSSGIGKAFAILAAKHGAHVTIVARNVRKLVEAVNEIKAACNSKTQKVQYLTLDVSNAEDVETRLKEADIINPIFMLVNCAGMAVCGKIEDIAIADVKGMIDVNYYGTYFPIKAIVGNMKLRREGAIVITGSQGSLLGIFGYSAYAGSKFALKGLAESLDMEVRPYNISVTLALPPDTDTPGFENENRFKPKETRMISEAAGIFRPDEVAKKIMKDALAGNFLSHIGFESFLLSTLCVGMAPFSSAFEIMYQSCFLGPFRLISSLYLVYFHYIIRRCAAIENVCKKTDL